MHRRNFLKKLTWGLAATKVAEAAVDLLVARGDEYRLWSGGLHDELRATSVHGLSTSTTTEWMAGPSGRVVAVGPGWITVDWS